MLKKECCIKCLNAIDDEIGWSLWCLDWIESDEERWEKRETVYCPEYYIEEGESIIRSITAKPPDKCPYYLENIL